MYLGDVLFLSFEAGYCPKIKSLIVMNNDNKKGITMIIKKVSPSCDSIYYVLREL